MNQYLSTKEQATVFRTVIRALQSTKRCMEDAIHKAPEYQGYWEDQKTQVDEIISGIVEQVRWMEGQ